MIKKSEKERQKLINDSNDYVKDLQKQTDQNNPTSWRKWKSQKTNSRNYSRRT